MRPCLHVVCKERAAILSLSGSGADLDACSCSDDWPLQRCAVGALSAPALIATCDRPRRRLLGI